MGMKKWLQKIHPTSLHVILVLSVIHFIAQLVICHITHALTLLLDSCHMLCNIIALVGCLITLKYDSNRQSSVPDPPATNSEEKPLEENALTPAESVQSQSKSQKRANDERRLRNTFGWARIEVLTMLVVCVFFASLCLSVILEAVQTLVHIDHMDAMHNPIVVFIMGAIGLCLNGICYILIGGYAFHQGTFIHITNNRCVVLEDVMTTDSVKQGQRRLSRSKKSNMVSIKKQRQGLFEALRDILSCFLVMTCAVIVYFVNQDVAKFIDPAIAIVSAFLLLSLTYPYMKESGMILLQTIPGAIDIKVLKKDLLKSFPTVVNVHDFHVWQLNDSNVVTTIHIIFPSAADYMKNRDDIKNFFLDEGITQVTIQPELCNADGLVCKPIDDTCLMTCIGKDCVAKHCCNHDQPSAENLSSVLVENKDKTNITKMTDDDIKENTLEETINNSNNVEDIVPKD